MQTGWIADSPMVARMARDHSTITITGEARGVPSADHRWASLPWRPEGAEDGTVDCEVAR